MSDSSFQIVDEFYGAKAAAELALARNILDALGVKYPGYAWGAGVNADSGMIKIELRLPMPVRKGMGTPGCYIKISTATGPDGVNKVLRFAGEILERYGLPRANAPEDWVKRAINGPDMGNAVLKSKY